MNTRRDLGKNDASNGKLQPLKEWESDEEVNSSLTSAPDVEKEEAWTRHPSFRPALEPVGSVETVEVRTLDDVVKGVGPLRCDYPKIDTDGAELEVLPGARRLKEVAKRSLTPYSGLGWMSTNSEENEQIERLALPTFYAIGESK